MKNELFSIGPFTIYGYGLMIGIGVIAAYVTAEKRAQRLKLDPERIFGLVLWCLISGYIGSKLLFCITVFDQLLEDPAFFFRSIQNGWVVYGGLLGGILGGYLYCKWKKLNFLSYFDLALPSVALAQAFGRIGCFLAGCCYGRPTDGPFGIAFTDSAYAPNGIPLIPTQLISSGLDFLHFFVLIWIAKRKKAEGWVGGFYLIFYSVGRFFLEFLRGDMERGQVGGLSTSQFIAIFTLAAGIGIVLLSARMAAGGVKAFQVGEGGTALLGTAAEPEATEQPEKDTEQEAAEQPAATTEQPLTATEQPVEATEQPSAAPGQPGNSSEESGAE